MIHAFVCSYNTTGINLRVRVRCLRVCTRAELLTHVTSSCLKTNSTQNDVRETDSAAAASSPPPVYTTG